LDHTPRSVQCRRPSDQHHVIVRTHDGARPITLLGLSGGLAQPSPDPVALDGSTDPPADRDAHARHLSPAGLGERYQGAAGVEAVAAEHALEVGLAREPDPFLHRRPLAVRDRHASSTGTRPPPDEPDRVDPPDPSGSPGSPSRAPGPAPTTEPAGA